MNRHLINLGCWQMCSSLHFSLQESNSPEWRRRRGETQDQIRKEARVTGTHSHVHAYCTLSAAITITGSSGTSYGALGPSTALATSSRSAGAAIWRAGSSSSCGWDLDLSANRLLVGQRRPLFSAVAWGGLNCMGLDG
jgi:hypothetical protein